MDYSTFEANTILNNPVTEETWLQFRAQKLTDSFAANENQIRYGVYPRFDVDQFNECMFRGEKKWECVRRVMCFPKPLRMNSQIFWGSEVDSWVHQPSTKRPRFRIVIACP